MGKRKSKRKVVKKAGPPPLDTQFTCPFCNHEKAVTCDMRKKEKVGVISCSVCKESWQSAINDLSDPIDVYSDWIDACEAANQRDRQRDRDRSDDEEDYRERGRDRDRDRDLDGRSGSSSSSKRRRVQSDEDEDEDEDED